MAVKEKYTASKRVNRKSSTATQWRIPQGETMRAVTKDASSQVIKRYHEALKKLKDH